MQDFVKLFSLLQKTTIINSTYFLFNKLEEKMFFRTSFIRQLKPDTNAHFYA